jgi:hypothetical protein
LKESDGSDDVTHVGKVDVHEDSAYGRKCFLLLDSLCDDSIDIEAGISKMDK